MQKKGDFGCTYPGCEEACSTKQNLERHMQKCHSKVAPSTPITATLEESAREVLTLIKLALLMRFVRCCGDFGKIPKFPNGQLAPSSNSNSVNMKDTEMKPYQQVKQLKSSMYRTVTPIPTPILDQKKEQQQQMIEGETQAAKEP